MVKRRKSTQRWSLMQRPGPGARVIGHLRVSTSMQTDKFSLPEQQRKIEELCQQEGWPLVGWCIEPGVSAKDDFDSRPEWKRLIFEQAGRDCDVILSHDFKRWCRNQAYDILSLEELRQRGVWWQTVEDNIDINHDQEAGKDIVIGVNRVMKAAYVRELAREVHKGKEGKARKGLSNGYPPFGYRFPVITLVDGKKPEHIVYEPHPDYFPVLQEIGTLAALRPALSYGEIARRLNARGYTHKAYGPKGREVPFSGPNVWKIISMPFYRAFRPDSDRGTIISPEGAEVEGQHRAAWDYALWEQIEQNRALSRQLYGASGNHAYAHVRESITFVGLLSCAHCATHLRAQHSVKIRGSKRYEGTYYRCQARYLSTECETARIRSVSTAPNKGRTSMREEVIEAQIGALLAQMVRHAQLAREALRLSYSQEAQAEHAHEVALIDYERKRRDLEEQKKRAVKAWIKRELTEDEKDEILAEIQAEIATLPKPGEERTPIEKQLAVVSAIEVAEELWRRTQTLGSERRAPLRHAALLKLFHPFGILCDTIRHQIVGLRPQQGCAAVMALMLATEGWQSKQEGLLWCDAPNLPAPVADPSVRERIYQALSAGCTTSREIAVFIHYPNLNHPSPVIEVLFEASEYGLVKRTRTSIKDRKGTFYRYELVSTHEDWLNQDWAF